MRVFFFLFVFLSWVLCAQDRPNIDTFQQQVKRIEKEIIDARDRKISIDLHWVEGNTQYLMKLVAVREELLQSNSSEDREQARSIDLQPLIDNILFVGKRLIIEKSAQEWSFGSALRQLEHISQELGRFDQVGFIAPHELYRPQKLLWDLEIIQGVLSHGEFVARVCPAVRQDQCIVRIVALTDRLEQYVERAKGWEARSKENKNLEQ